MPDERARAVVRPEVRPPERRRPSASGSGSAEAGQEFRANSQTSRTSLAMVSWRNCASKVEARMKDVFLRFSRSTPSTITTRRIPPARVARMFVNEALRGAIGRRLPSRHFRNVSQLNELMIVGPIRAPQRARSHHLCPIIGKVWDWRHAGCRVLTSSACRVLATLCEWIMSRPQIQEEAVVMLADELERRIRPVGLAV